MVLLWLGTAIASPPEGASLRVVVFPEAQADCAVSVSGASTGEAMTDASGRAQLEALDAGEVRVSVQCPGRAPVTVDSVFLVDDRMCEIGVTPAAEDTPEAARVWMSRLGPFTGSRATVLTRIYREEASVPPPLPLGCGPVE